MGDFLNNIDPRLQSLYEHWFRIRKGTPVPNRRDIDPIAIRAALPFVWMCDYIRESGRFRYRLAGEEMNIFHHRNLVGTYLDETLCDTKHGRTIPKYRRIIETPAILYIRGAIHAATHPHLHGERLLLPLSDTDERASIILGATVSHFDTADPPRESPDSCETLEIPLPL